MKRWASGYPAAWSAPWVMRRFFKNSFTLHFDACSDRKTGIFFAEHAHEKREAGFPPPPWSLFFPRTPPVHQDPADSNLVHRLLGRSFRHREYGNEGAAACFGTKLDFA